MLQLSTDDSFHFEILRAFAIATYHGSDIGEVLTAARAIEPSKITTFSNAFGALLSRVLARAEAIDSTKYPISARDAYFALSTYFRSADFYLHGNKDDPRINELWDKQTYASDRAITLLPTPSKRVLSKTEGFDVPAIFFGAGGGGKNPTLILGNGYYRAQEEMLHSCSFAALERGWNVITYEAPGQPSVVRGQGLGFIAKWEKVVTPVVDYLETLPEVDIKRVGLVGHSMGGHLCVRVAAFEVAIVLDGVYDVANAFLNAASLDMKKRIKSADPQAVESLFRNMLANPHVPMKLRWGIEQGLWSFTTDPITEFLGKIIPMSLKGLEYKV
jgi:hypothetical protein